MRRISTAHLAAIILVCGLPALTGCGRHGGSAGAAANTDEQLNMAAKMLDEHPDKAVPPEAAPLLHGNEHLR